MVFALRWLLTAVLAVGAGVLAIHFGLDNASQSEVKPPVPSVRTKPALDAPALTPGIKNKVVTPTSLTMPGVSADVVPLEMTGSTLTPPPDPTVLGWWGKPVSALQGVTLLVGHTVHSGGGALDNLETVKLGSLVKVSGVRYRVTKNEIISKAELAARSGQIFSQTGEHRLVVVTCEDYDAATGTYASNVVLVAELVTS